MNISFIVTQFANFFLNKRLVALSGKMSKLSTKQTNPKHSGDIKKAADAQSWDDEPGESSVS